MINQHRLLNAFLELARISSPSGHEEGVAAVIAEKLEALGASVELDTAGNLLARLDGGGKPLMLAAHMDTGVPCERVLPVVKDGVIYSDGTTILGADDKAGIAIILEVVQTLVEADLAHSPLELLFTVREEIGLEGAKAFDLGRLRAEMGIGLDAGGDQGRIVVNGPQQNSYWAQVHGRAAHAAVSPEAGINAILVAAEAIVNMPLGRIDEETTANIGIISGGSATNVVPDLVTLRGEARSRCEAKLEKQTRAMIEALNNSARAHGATADIRTTCVYDGFKFDASNPIVKLVSDAMRSVGVEPLLRPTSGGSDANIFNAAGLDVVQISVGMQDVHTCGEHVALADMVTATQIVLACVRS